MITGTTKNSRLIELKKYLITNVFGDQYHSGGSTTNNGVDYTNSISGVSVTYYIDGMKYVDNILSGITTFIANPVKNDPLNYIDVPYYKDPNLSNIIGIPKINDDVFIERQELSAFDLNYKLEFIKNLNDLNTYASGKFFNIVNYT